MGTEIGRMALPVWKACRRGESVLSQDEAQSAVGRPVRRSDAECRFRLHRRVQRDAHTYRIDRFSRKPKLNVGIGDHLLRQLTG
jgi:hypothetical protein